MDALFFPDDEQFEFEAQRALGHTAYGMADVGEVVSTCSRIRSGGSGGDLESWYQQWRATADRVAGVSDAALSAGHVVSARDAALRASGYYRSAEFFLHGDPGDPRIIDTYDRQVACFARWAELADADVTRVAIPYEGGTLPGWYLRAPGEEPNAVLVAHNGFDGSAEEMYAFGGAAALERGWDALLFDGPGQPGTRHHGGLVFRPDWEHVVGPVLDWLLAREGVDPSRVALLGESLGGVLAPRAAAFDDRIRALVVVDGLYDLGAVVTRGQDREEAAAWLRAPDSPEADAAMDAVAAASSTSRWSFAHGRYVMGAATNRAFAAAYLDYSLAGGIAERVACPTLVCDPQSDAFFAGQPQELFDHLTCAKTFLHFGDAEGAGAHCHVGALRLVNAAVMDWLQETLGG